MLEATVLPPKKEAKLQKPHCYGCKCTPKERRKHLLMKMVSLLLVAAVSAGSLGLVSASALPQPAAATGKNGKVPTAVQLSMPFCSTKHLLPCGSESVSAMMLLHYWGIPVSLDGVVAAMHKQPLQKNGTVLSGPDPDKSFAGDPRKEGSAGCYPPPLMQATAQFLPPLLRVQDESGTSLEQLARERLSVGEPVLIWATKGMKEPGDALRWKQPDGSTCEWVKNTACMVLIGYDNGGYWVDDPTEEGPVRWEKSLVKKRYEQIGSRCLIIRRAE